MLWFFFVSVLYLLRAGAVGLVCAATVSIRAGSAGLGARKRGGLTFQLRAGRYWNWFRAGALL